MRKIVILDNTKGYPALAAPEELLWTTSGAAGDYQSLNMPICRFNWLPEETVEISWFIMNPQLDNHSC